MEPWSRGAATPSQCPGADSGVLPRTGLITVNDASDPSHLSRALKIVAASSC